MSKGSNEERLNQSRGEKDAEIAELRAEVAYWKQRHATQRETYRELFEGMSVADWHRKHCAAMERAEAAEAKVARVEALAQEVERNDCTCECCRDDETPFSLRAALADPEDGDDRG